MIWVAASGSVGEMMAPSAKQAAHGSSGTARCAATATRQVVATTSPTALKVITRALARRSRSELE